MSRRDQRECAPRRTAGRRAAILRSTVALLLVMQATFAAADGDRRGRGVSLLPQYRDECSACHVAYPPHLLPAASWQRIMGNLGRHYGADASLDAATAALLSQWLTANAGNRSRMRETPPEDRITLSSWFLHEHGEISNRAGGAPVQLRPADCAACHTLADKGDFNERNIRIPR